MKQAGFRPRVTCADLFPAALSAGKVLFPGLKLLRGGRDASTDDHHDVHPAIDLFGVVVDRGKACSTYWLDQDAMVVEESETSIDGLQIRNNRTVNVMLARERKSVLRYLPGSERRRHTRDCRENDALSRRDRLCKRRRSKRFDRENGAAPPPPHR